MRILRALALSFWICGTNVYATTGKVVLAVHGGAGVLSKSEITAGEEAAIRSALKHAVETGLASLRQSRRSLDAVEAAVRELENSPLFNAGRGAAMNRMGYNEMDAAIMDGRTLKAGAVAGVTSVKNPISAARAVLNDGTHVLLSGHGADLFAAVRGLTMVEPRYFWTKHRLEQVHEGRMKLMGAGAKKTDPFGTVGAVALDGNGDLAAATSTGGLAMKRQGRIGDTPLIGAGTYAENRSAAVSCTGDGEYFIRTVAAHDISMQMLYGKLSGADAATRTLARIKALGGEGGVIVLDAQGTLATPFNSEGMYRAWATEDGKIETAIY